MEERFLDQQAVEGIQFGNTVRNGFELRCYEGKPVSIIGPGTCGDFRKGFVCHAEGIQQPLPRYFTRLDLGSYEFLVPEVAIEDLGIKAHDHILFILEQRYQIGTEGKLPFKNDDQLFI